MYHTKHCFRHFQTLENYKVRHSSFFVREERQFEAITEFQTNKLESYNEAFWGMNEFHLK